MSDKPKLLRKGKATANVMKSVMCCFVMHILWVCVRVCVCLCVGLHTVYVRVFLCMYACVSMCTNVYVFECVCMHVCVCVYSITPFSPSRVQPPAV